MRCGECCKSWASRRSAHPPLSSRRRPATVGIFRASHVVGAVRGEVDPDTRSLRSLVRDDRTPWTTTRSRPSSASTTHRWPRSRSAISASPRAHLGVLTARFSRARPTGNPLSHRETRGRNRARRSRSASGLAEPSSRARSRQLPGRNLSLFRMIAPSATRQRVLRVPLPGGRSRSDGTMQPLQLIYSRLWSEPVPSLVPLHGVRLTRCTVQPHCVGRRYEPIVPP